MFLLDPVIFPWDLAILVMIATGAGVACVAFRWLRLASRQAGAHRGGHFLAKAIIGVLGLLGTFGALVIIYGSFIEPHIITVTRHELSSNLRQPLKVALLADFHVGPYKGAGFVRRTVRETNALLPDVVLIAGDFLFDDRSEFEDLEPLKDLRASIGVYAVLGNHDSGHFLSMLRQPYELGDKSEELAPYLESLGVTVLRNEHELRHVGNDTLAIAGIDDIWSRTTDLENALAGIPANATTLLISHSPDVLLQDAAKSADLIVTGHTHGGQIRLPWIGSLAILPTRLGQQYDQGAFPADDDSVLVITRGLGETLARARLLAPPEIAFIELLPR